MTTVLQVAGLLFVITMTLGPLVGFLALLNIRDHRNAALRARMEGLTRRDVRDRIIIEVRSGVLLSRGVVAVDMRGCSREEIWDAIARWTAGLPSGVRLVVDGRVGREVPALLTVAPTGRPLRDGSAGPAAAAA